MKTAQFYCRSGFLFLSVILNLFLYHPLAAQYSLKDDDVVVENGIIQSCSYNFEIKDIIIPDTLDGQLVTGIASKDYPGVFNSKGIQSLKLPSPIQTIGGNAFSANQLHSLDLSSCTALNSIGNDAFHSNLLSSLDLSSCSALLSIESHAFSGNDSLTTITLPVNTEFKEYGWKDEYANQYSGGEDISDLDTYYFIAAPYTLTDIDVLISEGIIHSCFYSFYQKDIIIPDTLHGQAVKGIRSKDTSNGVFGSKGIVGLRLPSTIQTIGDYAFWGNSLSSLDLSSCTALISIGSNAFFSNQLQSLDLSSCTALTSIGYYAFWGNSLSSLDLSFCTALTTIGSYAFSNNEFQSLDLSSCTALMSIGSSAFSGNDSFTTITVPVNIEFRVYGWKDGEGNRYNGGEEISYYNTNYYIPIPYTLTDIDVVVNEGIIQSCFYNFQDKEIIIPDTLDGQAIIGIKGATQYEPDEYDGPFVGRGIRSVVFPSTLETIGTAFIDNRIDSIDLSICKALKTIEDGAFQDNRIRHVDLSNCTALTTIGDNAFSGTGLSNIDMSGLHALTTIGDNAFSGTELSNIDLSDCHALTSIGSGAFGGTELSEIDLSGCHALTTIGNWAFGGNKLSSLDLSGCHALTSIGDWAFDGNKLSSIDLSSCSALHSIGDYSFHGNELSVIDLNSLESLSCIGSSAFLGNDSLGGFTLPVNKTNAAFGWKDASNNSFNGGDFVTDLASNYYNLPYTLTDNDVKVKDGVIYIYSWNQLLNDIIIPDTLHGQAITGISDEAFEYCDITDIVLPSTLETIGSGAFIGNRISNLDFSRCVSLTSIGNDAFRGSILSEIDLSGCHALTTIGDYAFDGCKLTAIDLSSCSSLQIIGNSAFFGNELTNIDLSSCESLNYIGISAFQDNQFLAGFELPVNSENKESGWKDAQSNSFDGGDFVTDLTYPYYNLPYRLTDADVYIRSGILHRKSSWYPLLNDIIIPDSLHGQVITGIYAFSFKELGIANVTFPSTLETIGTGAFSSNILNRVDLNSCDSLTRIGPAAFSDNKLTSLDLSGCTCLIHIGESAFSENDSLSVFDLPVNSEFPDLNWRDTYGNSFQGSNKVSDLTSLYYVPISYTLTDIDVSVVDGLIQSCSYGGGLNEIIIPDTLDGQVVIGITGSYIMSYPYPYYPAFYYKGIKGISLPSTLEFIGDYAFAGNGLASVDFSRCTALQYIGRSAFGRYEIDQDDMPYFEPAALVTNNIKFLDLSSCSSLTSIGDYAFAGNLLESIDLPSQIRAIKGGAFRGNKLQSIDLAVCTSLNYIGGAAFSDIDSLGSLELPVNTANIDFGWKDADNNSFSGGDSVFDLENQYYNLPYTLADDDVNIINGDIQRILSWNHLLHDIIIPDSLCSQIVTGIDVYAFRDIDVTNITFPSTFRTIGANAFSSNKLDSIDLSSCTRLTFIGEGAFNGNPMSSFILPIPDIPGYIFYSWIDGNGNSYSGGDTVRDLSTSYTAVITAAYAVNFIVTDGVSPVPGALVSLAGYEANETDDSGMAVFAKVIPEIEIAYSVSAAGYDDASGILSVVDVDVIEHVTLSLSSYSVTFTVSDGTNPVQEATIALDGYENASTDGGGLVEFSEVFPENEIAYAVTHVDYNTVTGLVSVVDSDVVEEITLTPLTSVSEMYANRFLIYPNPTDDLVHILFYEDAVVSVLDVTGRVVLMQEHRRGESSISLGHLEAGGYFVRVESGNGVLGKRVMVQ